MKLTTGQIHDALRGLSAIEQGDETKLDSVVRLKIAISINRLSPIATAYERARAAKNAEVIKAEKDAGLQQAAAVAADTELRAVEHEIEITQFAVADFKLQDNQQISGALLSLLIPIISDAQ